jgi:hypothetical protein
MNKIILPEEYNYIGVFLTMRCNYNCPYCINWKIYSKYKEVDSKYWIENLSRIKTDLSVTLCGGEPSLYAGFYNIINQIPQFIDILTNLSFDVHDFIKNVNPDKFNNSRSFAPIRASFHATSKDGIWINLSSVLEKIRLLMQSGFRIGLYCVDCEENKYAIEQLRKINWLDFQLKPLLDNTVKNIIEPHPVLCATREVFLSPDGQRYNCLRDMFKQQNSFGLLADMDKIEYEYKDCLTGNECHPCALKIKRDRFGIYGYQANVIKKV